MHYFSLALLLLSTFSSLAGAASLDCGLELQRSSYMVPLKSTDTVAVAVSTETSNDEMAILQKAIDQWNLAASPIIGHALFKVERVPLGIESVPETQGDCGFPGSSSRVNLIHVKDQKRWSDLGVPSTNVVTTIRCDSGGKYVAKQVILINDSGEFSRKAISDSRLFTSILLHELGHAIGLDHSCQTGAGTKDYVECKEAAANAEISEAVMYPYTAFNAPKETLRKNDERRLKCILDSINP